MARKLYLHILLIAFFLIACVSIESKQTVVYKLPNKASCQMEALQLDESVNVYGVPKADGEPIAKLKKGYFAYKCEQTGEWLGIMFPDVSEKVDCSVRTLGVLCTLGWIPKDTRMIIFD